MLLGLSEPLPGLVEAKFRAAQAAKALLFSSTELAVIRASAGIPFQLRYCPALAKKPTQNQSATSNDNAGSAGNGAEDKEDQQKKKKAFDPFDNPPAALHIADIPSSSPTHLLVLNKFPVIPDHFILATKANKPQTDLLEPADLDAAYTCLREWESEAEAGAGAGAGTAGGDTDSGPARHRRRRLFAFFNSGPHSGASQPHRHLQFLPVERMLEQEEQQKEEDQPPTHQHPNPPWTLLLDTLFPPSSSNPNPTTNPSTPSTTMLNHPHLPLAHYALPLPRNPTPTTLHETYTRLYAAGRAAAQRYSLTHPSILTNPPGGSTAPAPASTAAEMSYNLALTTRGMLLVPRRAEGVVLPPSPKEGGEGEGEDGTEGTDGAEGGSGGVGEGALVALNGTLLAGTLMVKERADWVRLRRDPGLLDRVLEGVGVPREFA